jgi:hypothetical protein
VAEAGRIRTLTTPQEVAGEIRAFLHRLAPATTRRPARLKQLLHQWREGLIAVPIAGLLWLLAIPGATVVELERDVRVSVNGLPQAYEIEAVDPAKVRVTLAGRRRDLYFLGSEALEVRIDPIMVEQGRRSFSLVPANVRHPEGVEVRGIEPDRVKLGLRERKTRAPEPDEASGGKSGGNDGSPP